jgi:hypothetical protein
LKCAEAFHEAEAARRPTHRRVETRGSNPLGEPRQAMMNRGGRTQVEANHREGSRKAAGSSGSRDAQKRSTRRKPQGDQLIGESRQVGAIHRRAGASLGRLAESGRKSRRTTEKAAARRPAHRGVEMRGSNPRGGGRKATNSPKRPSKHQQSTTKHSHRSQSHGLSKKSENKPRRR